jgi:hypothetical protein
MRLDAIEAGQFDDPFCLASVEIFMDKSGLQTFDALMVEQVAGLVESMDRRPESQQPIVLFGRQPEGFR